MGRYDMWCSPYVPTTYAPLGACLPALPSLGGAIDARSVVTRRHMAMTSTTRRPRAIDGLAWQTSCSIESL